MLLLFALLLGVIAGCTKQSPTGTTPESLQKGAISGTIINGMDHPLAGATVTADPGGLTGSTDSAGHYLIAGVTPGTASLTVRKDGFSSSEDFLVHAGDTTHANLRLAIWKQVWQDEFDGTSLDMSRWMLFTGLSGTPHELQWYTTGDVMVGSGHLTLRSQQRDTIGFHYTSGDIHTIDTWEYGRFEVRARLPRGKGLWPAMWIWDDGTPEIDMAEMLGNAPNTIHMTYHFQDSTGLFKQQSMTYTGPDFSQDYHLYTVEWFPSEIRWLIDGVERFKTATVGASKPMLLILNTTVGGDWPGNLDSTTLFPQYYDVDYVRVYKSQ